MKKAFVMVDIQNDFCPGGSLAVKDGDKVIPIINKLQSKFDSIMATQDWHPANHESFAINHPGKIAGDVIDLYGIRQTLWPVHCVENTKGAEFKAELNRNKVSKVVHKGTKKTIDSYSTFYDNGHKNSTGLGEYLKELDIDEVYLAGLATDYCVKYSALDAVELSFDTFVIIDACRGINLREGDIDKAIQEMKDAGVKIVKSKEVL